MLLGRLRAMALFLVLLPPVIEVRAQVTSTHELDSLLAANAEPLELRGSQAMGPGFDLLVRSAMDAQFFLIGEEHNLRELNKLTVALFDTLQARYGYQFLVLEQGNIIASWLDDAARHGGRDSVDAIVRAYPHAPTFATDEELELITHVRRRSIAPGPAVWGVDQELAAMHLLERLAALSPSSEARDELRRLAEEARPHEETRTGEVHYLFEVADWSEYEAPLEITGPLEGAEERRIMDNLQRTVRIYTGRRDPLGAFESGREREASMRARFMEHYRMAERGGGLPRAIVKMGHWHTFRGIFRADVPTFGNFLTEFAASNGFGAVMVATYVVNGPEAWRNSGGVMARVADPDGITVIDLRPLRPLAHQGRIADLNEVWRDLIFQADLLLIIGGGRTGSYGVAHGTH